MANSLCREQEKRTDARDRVPNRKFPPTPEDGGRMSATQDLHHDFIHQKDGLRIACGRWQCIGPARGVIQIAHRMGEHSGRYSELIAALQGASLVVYANDHRGHGRTVASPERLEILARKDSMCSWDDMFELSRIAKKET